MSGPRGPVLVCGAAGLTGSAATRALHAHGVGVRALVHRAASAAQVRADGADETVVAELGDPRAWEAAMSGVAAAFLVVPTFRVEEPAWVAAALQAAAAAGVDRVVYHSVIHPHTPSLPHHLRKARAEATVRESGMRWSVLQPAMYAQTVLRMRARSAPGRLDVPYDPDAPFAVVDVHDVAECLVRVLADDAHVHGTFEVAGPEVATLRELAATMNEVAGERRVAARVAVETVPLPSAWSARQREEYAAMCRAYDAHGLVGSPVVARALLGRSPRPFAEVVRRELAAGRAVVGA